MSAWLMITLNYRRVPRTQQYVGELTVTKTQYNGEMLTETLVSTKNWEMEQVDLERMVEEIHHALQLYPDAKVTMIQGLTRPGVHRTKNRLGYELGPDEVNLIRTDLTAAKKLFAPIERLVKVQITPPSIELGTKGE